MIDPDLYAAAEETLDLLRKAGLKVATAESCTGGLIGAALTAVPGSSDVVDRGFITYSNEAKVEMIGVNSEKIAEYGAVSAPVAEEMAEGALTHSNADISVAVTGVAGPGQSERKPAGLVFISCAKSDSQTVVTENNFGGDRASVRKKTVLEALSLIRRLVRE